MEKTLLGRTEMQVTRTAFGALPLQRTGTDEAVRILRAARSAGITFYDTARGYTDSEEKIGKAFAGERDSVVVATKSGADTKDALLKDLETSLANLRTDRVDLMQLHNPRNLPDPADPHSSYAGLIEAKQKGMARFIGITSHSLERASAAVDSGLYDTLQYPLCSISSAEDLSLIDRCREANVGLIAMKPMCGGMLTELRPAFAFLRQFQNVVPIWGVQHVTELEELLALDADPPKLDSAMREAIDRDRRELGSRFCRACGYCLPCSAGIPIPMAARMPLLLKRMPYRQFLSDDWREKMQTIEDCVECGECRSRCPYELDPPAMLRAALSEYEEFYEEHAGAA